MKMSILMVVLVMVSTLAQAHVGEHDAPVVVSAPQGGMLKNFGELMVEAVVQDKTARLYVYDLKLKPRDLAGIKVSASVVKPKSKVELRLPLQNKGGHLVCDFSTEAKGLHRFTLRVAIDDPKTKHVGHVDFTVEP
ncbi:MAG: hypothetical protein JNJ49_05405 [Bdellovibrionaceae bacterium]|nr:hypothetical protein [Pseudobdellovibrionaceae bacterium]